jgi:hypothetical protein
MQGLCDSDTSAIPSCMATEVRGGTIDDIDDAISQRPAIPR